MAVVHDYLNQRGGAERVALDLASMWPDAPIYTTLYRPASTFPEISEREVRTSWLDAIPADAGFRNLFPLYPSAIRSLGVLDYDAVVTSSSGWAHGVRTTPDTAHVVYCHTPARWLYRRDAYLGAASWQQRAAAPLLGALRRWDRRAARRATTYVANSHTTRERIKACYGIDCDVVYPPVETDRFRPRPRGERYLVVSRLLDYKRVDAVIKAANHAQLPLDVVGTGPSLDELNELAGPSVELHGRLPDEDITQLMEECRAVVLPGEEDFGIVPVEGQAAGKPTVAFAAGGALETVDEGRTGTLFSSYEPQEVAAAMRSADDIDSSPREIAAAASRFSQHEFRRGVSRAVDHALAAA